MAADGAYVRSELAWLWRAELHSSVFLEHVADGLAKVWRSDPHVTIDGVKL